MGLQPDWSGGEELGGSHSNPVTEEERALAVSQLNDQHVFSAMCQGPSHGQSTAASSENRISHSEPRCLPELNRDGVIQKYKLRGLILTRLMYF